MQNNKRYDLSDRLTHFFRDLDTNDDSSPSTPEHWGFDNITEDYSFLSSIFLLRVAIRHGYLWATWAKRKERRTIYGPYPAICFADMPIAAFIETSRIRKEGGQKIDTYALTFRKSEMFQIGANPVIYGLSNRFPQLPQGLGPRIMHSTLLPETEQYRYVAYNPTGKNVVDWTHEREWRWPYVNVESIASYEKELLEFGVVEAVTDIPGLDLYTGQLCSIGVVVKTSEEANMVLHDILTLIDRKKISDQTYSYILVADKLGVLSSLRDPDEEQRVIDMATINLDSYLLPDSFRDVKIVDEVHKMILAVEREAAPPEAGEWGGCWLWILDNFAPVTRALLNREQIIVNKDGKYLVNLSGYDDSRSLEQRENMTKILAERISLRFRVKASYFSVLGSDDCDGVPFYNDDLIDNRIHYNWYNQGLCNTQKP